jgi:hypothetical protein
MSQPQGPDEQATGPQPHGSTAYGGSAFAAHPLPGQPVSDATQQLPPVWTPAPQAAPPGQPAQADARTSSDTVTGMTPVAPPRAPEQRPPSFWDGDAEEHHRDADQREPAWAPAPPAEATYGAQDRGPATGAVRTAPAAAHDPDATVPAWSDRPVAVRRPDTLAGLLLLLAGAAAGVSLLIVWVHGGGTGLDLVRAGFHDARAGTGRLADTGTWQPLAVVLGGAVLFLIGLFLFTPARTHRFLGGLALVVTVVVAAGVLVPLADAGWSASRFTTGFWFAVAVAGLGLLGALKALMTGPQVR